LPFIQELKLPNDKIVTTNLIASPTICYHNVKKGSKV